MSYQFLPQAAIDVTAFAKNTTGQVVIAKNRDVEVNNTYGVATDALYYENGDFTTVNGFEFTLRSRRVNRLQTFASYTYSDARGVNSDPNSNAGNLSMSMLSPPPMMIKSQIFFLDIFLRLFNLSIYHSNTFVPLIYYYLCFS